MKLTYRLNKNGLVVIGGKDLESEVIIPNEDCFKGKNYPVIAIGNRAFSSCEKLTSIVIPDSVTKIGEWAFKGCTGLTSINIPDSVTKIGVFAFHGCSALTSIIVDKGNQHYDSRENCNAIIESDSNTLVKGCSSTVIPDSVTEIGVFAFHGCSALTSIVIPSSVTEIGHWAFTDCSRLTSIIVDKENEHYDSREDCNAIIDSDTNTLIAGCSTTVISNSVTEIGEDAFHGCSALTSIVIPSSVTEIGHWAFTDCSRLTSIVIPDSVTKIGKWAFTDCSRLTSIIVDKGNQHYDSRENCNAIIESDTNTLVAGCSTTVIPDSVTEIGDKAFWACESLTSIDIPDSVTRIGDYAFSWCEGLTSIEIPDSVQQIGSGVFKGCDYLRKIVISDASLLKDADVPEGVMITNKSKIIAIQNVILSLQAAKVREAEANEKTFETEDLRKRNDFRITYKDGRSLLFKLYKNETYLMLTGYENIEGTILHNIPHKVAGYPVTKIGKNAFACCSGLTSIIIPDSVTEIGDFAFLDCESLTTFEIPNSVTKIGDAAFKYCWKLTSIVIPNSVIEIGNGAFRGCSGLISIIVDQGNQHYDSRENCNAIIESDTNTLVAGCSNTVIPDSVTKIGEEAFSGCSGLTSIVIPDSVTEIGNSAFNWCESLTSIVIPDSVTKIGDKAFEACVSLTSIDIPNSVQQIGSGVFEDCDYLRKIIISDASLLKNAGVPEGVEIVKP